MNRSSYNSPGGYSGAVADQSVETRSGFILKTYAHVFGALSAFALIEVGLFKSGLAEDLLGALVGTSWFIVMGAFMLIGWLCSFAAHRIRSRPLQYLALTTFVVAQAIIFVPLLALANYRAPGTISTAAYISFAGFAGLTLVALLTRKDFSFMRGMLFWGGICALIAIAASAIFGFSLGTWFAVGMVAFAGAAVLYNTSNILLHYPEDQYVAAALELFGSVALLFWYVLSLLNSRR